MTGRYLPPHTMGGNCPVCYGECGSITPYDEAHEDGDES